MKTVGSIRTKLQKLANTSFDELRTRGSQEFWKRWYLLRTGSGGSLVKSCEYQSAGSFFFQEGEIGSIFLALQGNVPEYASCLQQYAESICRHKFDLLGYSGLDYGSKIDWHCDKVSGKSAPLIPWFKIHFLDYSEVGDVKVTWELNRHQHLAILARAHRLTGEERYLEEVKSQFYDWRECNPYGIGVNWSSSLEVAFRSLSWLWVRELLPKDKPSSTDFRNDLNRALAISALHLERYLSKYFSPNTHLIGEGLALFFIGTCCQGPRSSKWQELGREIVLAEAQRQVLPDGMHFEQSTYYHVYTVDFFLHFLALAEANRIKIPHTFGTTVARMLDALRILCDDGCPIRFGDDDGGRVFDGRRNKPEDMLGPLATGAVLFNRPDWKVTGAKLSEEAIWLAGANAPEKFNRLRPGRLHGRTSCLPSAGLYLIRSDSPVPAKLAFDAGEQGAFGGGHSHADALNIQFSISGTDVLTDSGTYVYVSNSNDRRTFRSTAAHNTATVDDLDQLVAKGPFPWASSASVQTAIDITSSDCRLLRASHNGYSRLEDPVVHERTVFNVNGAFWFIGDAFWGKQKHNVSIRWNLAPGLKFHKESFGFSSETKDGLLTLVFDRNGSSDEVISGEYSSVYGRKQSREVLCQMLSAELPQSTATFIACHTVRPEILSVERLDGAADQITYVFQCDETQHQVHLPSPEGQILIGGIKVLAGCAYVSRNPRNEVRVCLYNLKLLQAENRTLMESAAPTAWLEIFQGPASQHCTVTASTTVELNEDLRPWLDSVVAREMRLTTSKGTS